MQQQIEIFNLQQKLQEILDGINNDTSSEDLRAKRKNLFSCIDKKITELKDSGAVKLEENERITLEEKIGQVIANEVNNLQCDTEEKKNFLGTCLYAIKHGVINKKNNFTNKIKKIFGLNSDSQTSVVNIIDEVVAEKFENIFIPVEKSLEKICAEQQIDEKNVEYSDDFSEVLKQHHEIKKIPLTVLYKNNIEPLKNLWTNIQDKVEKWKKNDDEKAIEALFISIFKLYQKVQELVDSISENTGAEDKSEGYYVAMEVLKENGISINFPQLNKRKKQTLEYLNLQFNILASNNNDSKMIKLIDPNANPMLHDVGLMVMREFSGMLNTAITYFTQSSIEYSINEQLNQKQKQKVPNFVKELAIRITEEVVKSLNSNQKVFDSLKDINEKAEELNSASSGVIKTNSKVRPDNTLQTEQSGALRHQIELSKYTLTLKESKLLCQAVGFNQYLLVPDKNQPGSYEKFRDKVALKLAEIKGRNSQNKWYQFDERTDHLEAALTFINHIIFKYNRADKPQEFLSAGLRRNEIKKRAGDGNEILEAANFRETFKNSLKKLSGFFSSKNKALKMLNETYNRRITKENALKIQATSNALPVKPQTDKLSARKKNKAITKWKTAQTTRNHAAVNEKSKPFTEFSMLKGILNSDYHNTEKPRMNDKINLHIKHQELESKHEDVKRIKNDLRNFQATLTGLYESTFSDEDYKTVDNELKMIEPKKDEDTINNTTIADYDTMIRNFNQLNALNIANIEVNQNQNQDFESKINSIYSVLFPEQESNDSFETKFKILLAEVRKHMNLGATLFGQIEKLNETINSNPDRLVDMREISQGLYKKEVDNLRRTINDVNFIKDLEEVEPNSETFLKKLGAYVEKVDNLLSTSTQKLKETALRYHLYLSGEIQARQQLQEILESLKEGDTFQQDISRVCLEVQDQLKLITKLSFDSGRSESFKQSIAAEKTQFIIETLKKLRTDNTPLNPLKESNNEILQSLMNELQIEKRKLPWLLNAAQNTLQDLKYRAAHTTQSFGAPRLQ